MFVTLYSGQSDWKKSLIANCNIEPNNFIILLPFNHLHYTTILYCSMSLLNIEFPLIFKQICEKQDFAKK